MIKTTLAAAASIVTIGLAPSAAQATVPDNAIFSVTYLTQSAAGGPFTYQDCFTFGANYGVMTDKTYGVPFVFVDNVVKGKDSWAVSTQNVLGSGIAWSMTGTVSGVPGKLKLAGTGIETNGYGVVLTGKQVAACPK